MRLLGRYALHGEIAVGGMATVHFGRLHGSVGFQRTVAIKRLHKQYARDPEFVSMFLDEARLAARIRHPNVVPTLDVVTTEGELFVVMEYVHGESLSRLIKEEARAGRRIPPRIVGSLLSGTLQGLHAAHEARDERGSPLNIVHRDVSPQNILVGSDGIARVLDFGVAKAAGRIHTTREGQIKGKLPYMAPEQLQGDAGVSRQVDIYAAAVCLWEALTGHRLFAADNEAMVLTKVLHSTVPRPSEVAPNIPPKLDALVMRGLSRNAAERFATAREMALALEQTVPIASTNEVAVWMESVAGATLQMRGNKVAEIEQSQSDVTTSRRLLDEISQTRRAFEMGETIKATELVDPYARPSMTDLGVAGGAPSGPVVAYRDPREISAQSQLSALSQQGAGGFGTARARRGMIVVLGALAALVVVLGAVVLSLELRDPAGGAAGTPTTAAATTPAPDPNATGTAAPGQDPGAGAAAPTATGLLGASPSAMPMPPSTSTSTTAGDEAPTADAPRAAATHTGSSGASTPTPRTGATHVAARATAAPSKKSCDPPYTIDAAGRKQFKVECL